MKQMPSVCWAYGWMWWCRLMYYTSLPVGFSWCSGGWKSTCGEDGAKSQDFPISLPTALAHPAGGGTLVRGKTQQWGTPFLSHCPVVCLARASPGDAHQLHWVGALLRVAFCFITLTSWSSYLCFFLHMLSLAIIWLPKCLSPSLQNTAYVVLWPISVTPKTLLFQPRLLLMKRRFLVVKRSTNWKPLLFLCVFTPVLVGLGCS